MEANIDSLVRYRSLKGVWRWIGIIFPIVAIYIVIDHVFCLRFFVGYALPGNTCYYLLLALIFPLVFLYIPAKPKIKGKWVQILFWIDIAIFFLALVIGLYFAWYGETIITRGWARVAPMEAIIMAIIVWLLIIEAVRRTTGISMAIFVFVMSMYPVFAHLLPGFLEGINRNFFLTVQFHILSNDSAMGMLIRLYASTVLGYTLFGVVMVAVGGGEFLINLPLSVFGRLRGGAAKVAIFASAFLGAISGNVIMNVITTGAVTIPAMKKSGYKSEDAAAIECVASTGASLSPPVMGLCGFVMASFIGIEYKYVILAATIPAILYYFTLYLQVDALAVKSGIKGMAKSEVPLFMHTLKNTWFFILPIALLIYLLIFLRLTSKAAFLTTALLLVLSQFRKESRFTIKNFLQLIDKAGKSLTELFVIMLGVGLLLGSFSITGLAASFARELLNIAGGNVPLLLLLGAVGSLIMGMGMSAVTVYIFLAIIIAPALVLAGLNELAVHLFLLYCGLLSWITPPVALSAFPAAILANSSLPMKVALKASFLGGALYILPFLFVTNPNLILQGEFIEIIKSCIGATIGLYLIASALAGYVFGIGNLWDRGAAGYFLRAGLIVLGLLISFLGWQTNIYVIVIAFVILFPALIIARRLRCRRTEDDYQ